MTPEEKLERDREKNREKCRKWRAANPEADRKWRTANPEKVRANGRRWRAANPEKNREQNNARGRKWRTANPEKHRERNLAKERRYRATNPGKYHEKCRKWRAANPETFRESNRRSALKTRYNTTPEVVNAKLVWQLGQCEICPKCISESPVVDHCHVTQTVRGLLCRTCNLGLGHFADDPARLRAAADYVEKYAKLHATQDALSPPHAGSNHEPPPRPATQTAPSP